MSILDRGFGLDYLFDFHDGKIKMGLGLDCVHIDDYIRFKKGQFVMINGLDNVGKTHFMLWYFLVIALKHNKKFVLWSGENRTGQQKRDLIQMLTGVKFKDLPKDKIVTYLEVIDQHFEFVNNSKLYDHKQILKLFKDSDADGGLIDPFTGLNHNRGVNQWERNYMICNEIRQQCNTTGQTIYVNTHPQTEAARRVFPDKHLLSGYIQPPKKSDTEGGQTFANRCDDFITIHRLVNHPDLWMLTEVHVRKVKDTETGGKPTFLDEPMRLDYNRGLGFTIGGIDPLSNLRMDADRSVVNSKVMDNSSLNKFGQYEF